jgi:transposase-like protein
MSGPRGTYWQARTTRWREADARSALDAWKRSGQSAHAFAREHGITAQRLYWWRDRLSTRQLKSLVPGEVVGIGAEADRAGAPLQVVIRAGEVTLKITGADAAWVARLVRELAR